MTQNTQYEPIRIANKTQINQKQNSNTNLYGSYTKICKIEAQEQIEHECTDWIESKQHLVQN